MNCTGALILWRSSCNGLAVRVIISMLIAYSCLSPVAVAQKAFPSSSVIQPPAMTVHTKDFSKTVVPITSVKITPSLMLSMLGKLGPNLNLDAGFGTGFCLDAGCRFIATNYHVAATTKVEKIQGDKIVQRYFATGPDENGATANILANGDVLPYATKRDLAVLELRRSLRHHQGLAFSLDELEAGQEVDIYGYPKEGINPFRRLTRFPAKFKGPTTSGLLAFDLQLAGDQPILKGGASGGIVVDRKTEKIVGILSGVNTAEQIALAVSSQTLAEFVITVQPFLAQTIFPATKQIAPVSPDIYPKFIPPRSDGLQRRPEEPDDVRLLRQKAQSLVDSIREFTAVESYAWGEGDKQPDAEANFEVRVIDGNQSFRDYPDGKKESKEPPQPPLSAWIIPADEWSQLPTMIGTEPKLKIRQVPDVLVNEQRMKVFQYHADIEDKLCVFEAVVDYGFFTTSSHVDLPCYGEVWTDEHMNILRISQQMDFSQHYLGAYKGWMGRVAVLTYGFVKLADQSTWLVPLTTYVEGHFGGHIYWCRGNFTEYHVFGVRARLVVN